MDDLRGLIGGILLARRDPCYGALQISDEQVREIENAVTAHLVAIYEMRAL